jgi:glycosyl transferase family 87
VTARARNLLNWAGIVAGADILAGAVFAWLQYLRGPSLRLGHGYPDFVIYSALGHQLVQHGFGSIYDLDLQRRFQEQLTGSQTAVLPYISPPYLAPLWWPFGWLDLKTGYIVWASITAVLLIGSVLLVVRSTGLARRERWAVGLLALSWVPSLVTVLQGQTTGLVLLGVAAAAVFWIAGREIEAGGVSFLGLVRPHMVLALPLLYLARSRNRALPILVETALVVCILTLPLVGFDNWRGYLQLVTPWLVHGQTLAAVAFEQARYSLRGLLDSAGLPAPVVLVALAAVAIFVLVSWLRGTPRRELDVAIAVTASVVLSPHQNLHDLVLLAVPLVIAAGMEKRQAVVAWVAIGACYLGVELALFNPLGAQLGMLALLAYLCGERLWPRRQLAN